MKKLSASILAVALILTLAGCKSNTSSSSGAPSSALSSPAGSTLSSASSAGSAGSTSGAVSSSGSSATSGAVSYKDGTYDVKHKSLNPGYEEAVVTIKDGKIQNIELKRLDQNQKEIDYNKWDGTNDGYPNLKKYRVDLAKAMLDKQSTNVESISGATKSSVGWKTAVDQALAKAK